ncbi:MAG: hypothetical protein AAFU41_00775 [Pseudomonadota bacterium]
MIKADVAARTKAPHADFMRETNGAQKPAGTRMPAPGARLNAMNCMLSAKPWHVSPDTQRQLDQLTLVGYMVSRQQSGLGNTRLTCIAKRQHSKRLAAFTTGPDQQRKQVNAADRAPIRKKRKRRASLPARNLSFGMIGMIKEPKH